MSSDPVTRPSSLPHDLASCHAMLEEVFQALRERDQQIEQLEQAVDQLVRARFGSKSERYDASQLKLFDTTQEDTPPVDAEEEDATE